jgi:hypothetical protein
MKFIGALSKGEFISPISYPGMLERQSCWMVVQNLMHDRLETWLCRCCQQRAKASLWLPDDDYVSKPAVAHSVLWQLDWSQAEAEAMVKEFKERRD